MRGASELTERTERRRERSERRERRERVSEGGKRESPQSSSSDCEENFGAKRPMIVASLAPEPCRSFVFGPRLYAQHPFDFELAPSTTISGAV